MLQSCCGLSGSTLLIRVLSDDSLSVLIHGGACHRATEHLKDIQHSFFFCFVFYLVKLELTLFSDILMAPKMDSRSLLAFMFTSASHLCLTHGQS